MSVAPLRQLLEDRFPGTSPLPGSAPAVSSGIEALDRVLPGGFPRGRLTVWEPGGGAETLLRQACLETCRLRETAVWIDATGTLPGDGWPAGPVLVRPPGRTAALACAEEMSRCGGVALVVLCGTSEERVRLSRAAREGGAALVVLGEGRGAAALRCRSEIRPSDYLLRLDPLGEPIEVYAVRLRVRAQAMGWMRKAEILVSIPEDARRLSLDPGLGDRRGSF